METTQNLQLSAQNRLVLDILLRDNYITRVAAAHYNIANVTARISELRSAGFDIPAHTYHDLRGRRYARWVMTESDRAYAAEVVGA